MSHHASPSFWRAYRSLPVEVQRLADRAFARVRSNPQHPSLQLKRVERFWSARVGLHYRALAVQSGEDLVWFWIGSHADYDRFVG